MRIRFLVSYDGTGYCGWQRQGEDAGRPSIQSTLEEPLSRLFRQPVSVSASGRTDAGVHALAQVCHFDVDIPRSRFDRWDFCWAMKAVLPDTITIRKAWEAPEDFHSTLSATHKTYRYFVYNHPRSNPFLRRTSLWLNKPVDLEHLQRSSQFVVGEHDFKSFQSVGTPVRHTVREVYQAEWIQKTRNVLQFTITGSGFLKQMVRNIVGTQLLLEKNDLPSESMADILAARDRRAAGPPAGAEGLFLWKVYYPPALDKQCRPL